MAADAPTSGVFALAPARAGEMHLPNLLGAALQACRHRVVPAIEVAEQGNHAQDLHDLPLVPVRAKRFADLGRDRVGNRGRSKGEIESGLLGLAE